MPIEMPKGLPFSVDTWTPSSNRKRYHFLTHAHKDHVQGISVHASFPIYSTLFTKNLICLYYPQVDESIFVSIEIGQSLVVKDLDGDFTVSAFDANHCPGAVMFLFEGKFGNILHTGDCRLTPECLQNLPEKYVGKEGKKPSCPLDYIFLDCTFGQFSSKIPSQHTAIQQVINCIWKHPDSPTVYLICDLLGQEEILAQVSKTFGDKIYVDKEKNADCVKALELTVPEILSQDLNSRFQLFDGFPGLYERAEAKIADARTNFKREPLIIRPSTRWYACDEGISKMEKRKKERFDQAIKDLYGVWHVCFSIHSSRDELEWALKLLAPKWVVSTTPSCRAIELNYVKKNCQRTFDDSLWKLLDIGVEEMSSFSLLTEIIPKSGIESQFDPPVISTPLIKRLSISPPSKRPMFTLFGRARLNLQDSLQHEPGDIVSKSCDKMKNNSTEAKKLSFQKEEVIPMKFEESSTRETDFPECLCETAAIEADIDKLTSTSSVEFKAIVGTGLDEQLRSKRIIFTESKHNFSNTETMTPNRAANGYSFSYNESLRKFYRSLNVPIPRPLPSLAKFLDAKRCSRKRM